MRTSMKVSLGGVFIVLNSLLAALLVAQDTPLHPVEISFDSDGCRTHGWFYQARGKGPFPTVVMLHGFPGKDGDLFDVGQNLAREGFNALTFSYSGTWKSEGQFLPETSLRNVSSAVDFLRSEQSMRMFAVDTSRIAIMGYGYGGGMALLGSLCDHSVRKAISIAGGDLSVIARMIEASPDFRQAHRQFLDQCMRDSSVARGLAGTALHEWLLKHKDEYDLVKHAASLATKDIL